MRMTDLTQLEVPEGLAAHLAATTRDATVRGHRVPVAPAWWAAVLADNRLPGTVRPDSTSADLPSLSRQAIFDLGGAITSSSDDEAVLTYLWHVLAWGSRGRNNRRRVASVASQMPAAAATLRQACIAARESPEDGYRILRQGRSNAIPYLGPAFLTKVLYFAGGGTDGHHALILDDRVAAALSRRHGWHSLRTGGGWPPATYTRYCDLLDRWASGTSTQDRTVAPDEIEYWLFSGG